MQSDNLSNNLSDNLIDKDSKKKRLGRPFNNRPNHSLSRQTVLTSALIIVQSKGIEELSIKGLAESLNSSRPPLYSLFKNRSDLIVAVVDEILLFILPNENKLTESWQENILRQAQSAFECFNKFPGVANELVRTGFPDTPVGRDLAKYYASLLTNAGFPSNQIPSLILAITSLLTGASAEIIEQQKRQNSLLNASSKELQEYKNRQGKTLPMKPLNNENFSFAVKLLIQGMESWLNDFNSRSA